MKIFVNISVVVVLPKDPVIPILSIGNILLIISLIVFLVTSTLSCSLISLRIDADSGIVGAKNTASYFVISGDLLPKSKVTPSFSIILSLSCLLVVKSSNVFVSDIVTLTPS